MLAPEIVTPVELPMSNASVLWPSSTPFELSRLTSVTVRSVALLMLINWTGESLKLSPVMEELVKLWA